MSVEIDLCAAKLWKLLRFWSLRNDWANKSVSRLFSVFTPHSNYCIHCESLQSWSLQFWVPRECDLIKTVNFLFPTLDVSLLSAFNSLWYSYKDIGTLPWCILLRIYEISITCIWKCITKVVIFYGYIYNRSRVIIAKKFTVLLHLY